VTIEFEERHRQVMRLALGRLSVERPGWAGVIGEMVDLVDGRALFEQFAALKQREMADGSTEAEDVA
jgi:hypothetical protein